MAAITESPKAESALHTDVLEAPKLFSLYHLSQPSSKVVKLTESVEETFKRIATALNHQTNLESKLQAIADGGITNMASMHSTAVEVCKDVAELRAFLNGCLNSIPITMRPTPSSAVKAQQVFDTAELLEAVMTNLHAVDVLSAVQVSRTMSKMVSASPKLQDVLQLRPSKDGHLASIFLDSWGTKFRVITVTLYEHTPGQFISPSADLAMPANMRMRVVTRLTPDLIETLPKICHRMLICQPPVKTMNYAADCCSRKYNGPAEASFSLFGAVAVPTYLPAQPESQDLRPTVTSETGLTIGDLYQITVKVRKEHLHCPHANQDQHHKDGTVRAMVAFDGEIELQKNDPFIASEVKRYIEGQLEEVLEESNDVAEGKMRVYVEAKKIAAQHGWPIPTLQEFEAEYADTLVPKQSTRYL
ncbi:hypothetical protein LTR37_002631 [Vermiconidia calcicola]|uniref:Uncharacterized protein n=1 Tax=Vermiconidia calcicola TaxID=1690605 RepID=A0ACC3NSU7_9PEZI|nr:hypothetical protein LTR37_002631 [Vermiconidia calcicola]